MAALSARRKAAVRQQGGRVHQPVRAMLNPINPTGGDAITWFIASGIHFPLLSTNAALNGT
ncbi:MAG TPA: hypothetical protein VFP59_07695 [Candidatus Angelobacter sp.]|nr:hypothetical protein [Candidatus Angelobacter sp.]